jgi:hypothetical protein
MGGRIARRIAAAGHRPLGHDLDPRRADAAGVEAATSLAALIERSGVVLLSKFGLAAELGYGDQISNRVVDALGDVAGGVRLHGQVP